MIRSGSIARPLAPNHAASVSRWSCEKLVTTRNGIPRAVEAADRLDRARQRRAVEDDDAVGVEHEAAHPAERRPEPIGRHRPMVGCPATARAEDPDGTARRQDGAHLRGRQRPFDRVGHRPGAPRRGRRGRLLVGREPHREARAAAGGLDRVDVRRALRRPVRRADRARLRALGRDPPIARHPRPRARLRAARGPRGRRSSTRRATGSRSRSTSRPTRSSRSRARRGRSCDAGRRS